MVCFFTSQPIRAFKIKVFRTGKEFACCFKYQKIINLLKGVISFMPALSYEELRKNFSWDKFCNELFDWDINEKFNITHEAIEKHDVDPKKVALFFVDSDFRCEKYTYRDLNTLSSQFANVLKNLGLEKGDRVARLLPRIPETYITFFGTWKAGMVDVPLYTAFGPEAIEYRVKDCGAKVLVTDYENREKVAKIARNLEGVKIIVVPTGRGVGIYGGDLSFWHEMGKASGKFETVETKADDLAVLVYTSGTTGPPKGTEILQKGIVSVLPYAKYCLDVKDTDMYWGFADPGWTYGLFSAGSTLLVLGQSLLIFGGRFTAESWYHIMDQYRVTNFTAAPTAYRAIMAAGDELPKKYEIIARHFSSGGEPLNKEVISWFKRHFNVNVRDNYGITEVSMLICNSPYLPLIPGSMGKPMPGFEVKLVDRDGREVPTGQHGVIAAKRNPFFLSNGYWKKPEKWASAFVDGDWFVTGDQAYCDENGYYYFVGRDDDVISSAGYRIGPFEVESTVLEHPSVAECAVVGKPDELRGEIVKAYIVLKVGYQPSDELAKEIQQFVRERLAKHNYPREIEFLEDLPKTSSGKIKRVELRKRG